LAATLGALSLATMAVVVATDVFLVHEGKESWGTLAWDTGTLAFAGAARVGEGVFTAARAASHLEDAATAARAASAELDAAADVELGAWLNGEGDIGTAVGLLTKQAAVDADADLLSTLAADTAREASIGAAVRSVAAETVNPGAAWSAARDAVAAKSLADSYSTAPSLVDWLRANPTQAVPLVVWKGSEADEVAGFARSAYDLVTAGHGEGGSKH
jgi:hypothetical protein